MATSYATAAKLLVVLARYVPQERMSDLLRDLAAIEGNASFHNSVREMTEVWKDTLGGGGQGRRKGG